MFSCGSRRGGVNPRFGTVGVLSGVLAEPRGGEKNDALPGTFRVLFPMPNLTSYRS